MLQQKSREIWSNRRFYLVGLGLARWKLYFLRQGGNRWSKKSWKIERRCKISLERSQTSLDKDRLSQGDNSDKSSRGLLEIW